MIGARLYLAQRLTAMLMVPLVIGHLAVMVYAVRGGLSVGEILDRTRGSLAWFAFYGLFVAAASVHAAIGLRAIAHEMAALRGRALDAFTLAVGLALLLMGARAVWSVTFSGALA